MLRGAMVRDLLPWADPYVAQLIKKLQDEVRQERRAQSLIRRQSRVDFLHSACQSTQLRGEEE
jgi:hypothetical protein